MKRFMSVFMAYILLLQTQAIGHGFAGNTPITVKSSLFESMGGGWRNIASVYEKSNDLNRWIITYDLNNDSKKETYVRVAGESKTSCYFKIKTHTYFTDEIICTPTQEFYLPAKNKWVSAYNLRVGDHLLTEDSILIPIIGIEFYKKPIKIYALEVDETHCYFVGQHAVLTHNIAIPACYIGLSVAFGEGAIAGGSSSAYFGPIAFAGGIVIGGVLGVGYYTYTHYSKRRFKFDFDADNFGKRFESRYGHNYESEHFSFNDDGSGPTPDPNNDNDGPFPPPDDYEDDNDERDDRPERSLIREIRNLKKQIDKHADKLNEYIKNPDKYDNRNMLRNAQSNAQRENIIRNRVKSLVDEMDRFQQGINRASDELLRRGIKWNK